MNAVAGGAVSAAVSQLDLIARGTADMSACGRYRYRLTRELQPQEPKWAAPIVWLMLNPSSADASADDPTIRKVVGFSARWGYSRLVVVNLFAWISTNPSGLLTTTDPVGPENDRAILTAARAGDIVMCAWGASLCSTKKRFAVLSSRVAAAMGLLAGQEVKMRSLIVTSEGQPTHPVRRPYSEPHRPFRWRP